MLTFLRFLVLAAALALALAGCSSPTGGERRELHKGATPGFPTPGATPAGAGAPTVGQPGQVRAPIPRSPHKRVLPPSKGPGLWAGDQPRASADPDFKPGFLLGMWLPLPENLEASDQLGYECAAEGAAALAGQGVPEALNRLLPGDFLTVPHWFNKRHCLAARMYAECAERKLADRGQLGTKALELIREWARGKCSLEGANPPEVDAVLRAMRQNRLH